MFLSRAGSMQFSLIVVVLAALIVAENCPQQPVGGLGYRLTLAVTGMACVVAFAAIVSRHIARRLEADPFEEPRLLKRYRRLRNLHTVLLCLVAGAILLGLDWASIVRFNWRLDGVVLLDELLVLAPVLLPLILSWAAFYEVERVLQSLVPRPGEVSPPRTTRRQYVVLQLRHCLGLLLLPVLGLAGIQDTAELAAPDLLKGGYALLIYVPPMLLLFAFFPTLLRYVWLTWPLGAGSLHDRLHAAAQRAGFRCRKILVWHTNGTLVNAAVAGFVPRLRYVFLTDGLLAQLTDEEIEAVFGHEVGHVRHRHLLLRIVAMAAPVSLWLLADQAFPQVGQRFEELLAFGGLGAHVPMGLLMLAVMVSYGMVVFGSYSRLLEGQADLFGCRTLDPMGKIPPVETFVSALEKLAASSGVDRNAASWQHASIARRVEFIYRATRDPCYERRFHCVVRLLSGLLAAIVISPVIYLLVH